MRPLYDIRNLREISEQRLELQQKALREERKINREFKSMTTGIRRVANLGSGIVRLANVLTNKFDLIALGIGIVKRLFRRRRKP